MNNLKPYLKAIVPFVATILAVALQWAVTGEFDRAEMVTAITGLLASAVTYLVPNAPVVPPPGN